MIELDVDAFEKQWEAYLNRDSVPPSRQQMSQLIARVRELEAEKSLPYQLKLNLKLGHRIKILEQALELACGGECAANNCFSAHGVEHLVKERIQQAEREIADKPDESNWTQNDRMEQSK